VLWELSKDILKKDMYPGENTRERDPVGTRSVYNGKYSSQGWTPVLKEHLAGPVLCLKGCSDIYVIVTQI
jgi:hypothetical protein